MFKFKVAMVMVEQSGMDFEKALEDFNQAKVEGKISVCRQTVRMTNRTDCGQTVRRQIVRTD